jgi:predicted anti-sigma-YlaC factor YlaD
MSCPDIDHLIDLAAGATADAELQAHLESCSSCRGDLLLIRELPGAFRRELEIPDPLVQRIMADVGVLRAREESRRGIRTQIVSTAILGSLTTAGVVFLTGAGTLAPAPLLTFSLSVGALAAATRFGAIQRKELDRV